MKKLTFRQHFPPLLAAVTTSRNESKASHPCEVFSNENITWQDHQQAVHEEIFSS